MGPIASTAIAIWAESAGTVTPKACELVCRVWICQVVLEILDQAIALAIRKSGKGSSNGGGIAGNIVGLFAIWHWRSSSR